MVFVLIAILRHLHLLLKMLLISRRLRELSIYGLFRGSLKGFVRTFCGLVSLHMKLDSTQSCF